MKVTALSWNIWQGKYTDGIIETIKKYNPDVVGLLEVDEGITTNTAEIIAKKLGYYCAYYRTYEKDRDGEHYLQGNAVLSKYKILSSSLSWLNRDIVFDGTSLTEPRALVSATIKVKGRILTINATHLAHVHNFSKSKTQMIQTEELLKRVSKKNTILMGDFNALPKSDVIRKIEETLLNTDTLSDKNTWSVYPKGHKGCRLKGINYRLDYIFASKDLEIVDFQVVNSKSSDHLSVLATVEV